MNMSAAGAPKFAKALVTGATGFLGSRLTARLAESGTAVSALIRRTSAPEKVAELPDSIDIIPADSDNEALIAHVSKTTPDVIFHLAARYTYSYSLAEIPGLLSDNITLTAQICEAATTAGCTNLVVAGTAWQNAGSPPGDESPAPNTLYAATKQAADDIIDYYAAASELNAVTLKIYDSYGPGDPRRKFLQALADAADTGETLASTPGAQLVHMVHAEDLVDGFVHAGNLLVSGKLAGRTSYTLPSQKSVSLRELVEIWQTATDNNVSVAWGANDYRDGEVMVPWEGTPLPGWSPQIDLETGLRGLQN
ncbi:MAG: hypothetical protein CL566_00295 [Alphaproteobacteria bacterium]|nr:hypothetical protein [Alphaproteobacteria bacterium]